MSPKRREMHFGVFVLGTGNHSAGWRHEGAAQQAAVAPAAGAAPAATADREALFWQSIEDSSDPAGFQAYLQQYPQGAFAALARQRLAAGSSQRFDGIWNVTVECPPNGPAAGYTIRLVAHVKDGALSGQMGNPGPGGNPAQGSLTLSGKIQPDGKASIDARGTVGDPRTAANQLQTGQTYGYRAEAFFDGTRGVGKRVDHIRPCILTFVK